jgi:hypothetical protein
MIIIIIYEFLSTHLGCVTDYSLEGYSFVFLFCKIDDARFGDVARMMRGSILPELGFQKTTVAYL